MTAFLAEPLCNKVAMSAAVLLAISILPASAHGHQQLEAPAAPGTAVDALVRSLLLQNLPREYENAKNWGQTKRRWNGLHLSLDGLRIDSKRRWKEVNHGTWTRYRAWLLEPDRELRVQFQNLRRSGTKGVAFDLIVDARIGSSGRLSQWNHGVQLYSLSAEADGKVRLRLACELDLQLDLTSLPFDVILAPRIQDATVQLLEFRLHRISDADGPLVKKLGESLHREIESEIQQRQPKLVEKLNRAIEKNQDHLRLSIGDLIASGWEKLLPETFAHASTHTDRRSEPVEVSPPSTYQPN